MRPVEHRRFMPASPGSGRTTLIDHYLGRDDHAVLGTWAPALETPHLAGVELVLHDTGRQIAAVTTRDDATTMWHLLWVREEVAAGVSIGSHRWPIAPGDTAVVPPGAPLLAEGRQLAVAIAVPGADEPGQPPTHGEERFFGYNRQTTCCLAGGIRLCRWKLTQPLALAEHHPGPALVLALARDAVIRTATTIDRLRQGELALIDPAPDPIVTPDGLAYLLTVDRDPRPS